MRVNSAFTVWLSKLPAGARRLSILLTAIIAVASSFSDPFDRTMMSKQVNVIIREIGHNLLLQAGDSTSRVLPIVEINKGTFLLRFENELVFHNDSLLLLSQRLLPKTKFPSGYIVTVQDCNDGRIVYGFQLSNTTPDLLPCRGRDTQPERCYTIEFIFQDLYKNITQTDNKTSRRAASGNIVKVDSTALNLTPGNIDSTTATFPVDKPIAGSSSEAHIYEADGNAVATTPSTSIHGFNGVMYAALLILLVGAVLFWRFQHPKPAAVPAQDHLAIKEATAQLPMLGRFSFDVSSRRLVHGDEAISLTEKECRVLELLHKSFGKLMTRETLLEEVWISEGVITGRSLDMFVSKLRKKLSGDPGLRITNIHGKGYKLEATGEEFQDKAIVG